MYSLIVVLIVKHLPQTSVISIDRGRTTKIWCVFTMLVILFKRVTSLTPLFVSRPSLTKIWQFAGFNASPSLIVEYSARVVTVVRALKYGKCEINASIIIGRQRAEYTAGNENSIYHFEPLVNVNTLSFLVNKPFYLLYLPSLYHVNDMC